MDPSPPAWLSVLQGRHVKTGQLAAIKVMDVTEVGSSTGQREGRSLEERGGGGLSGLTPLLPVG